MTDPVYDADTLRTSRPNWSTARSSKSGSGAKPPKTCDASNFRKENMEPERDETLGDLIADAEAAKENLGL